MKNKLLILLSFFMVLLVQGATADLEDGLIGVYKFENTSMYNNIDGEYGSISGATINSNGVDGNYLDVDSGDYASVFVDSSLLPSEGEYTLTCWVRLDSSSGSMNLVAANGTANKYSPALVYDDPGDRIYFYDDGLTDGGDAQVTTITNKVLNEWGHFAMNCNNNQDTVWFNGTNTSMGDYVNSDSCTIAEDLQFGRRGTDAANTVASFDECYLWNRTLNSSEITDLQTKFYPFTTTPVTNTTVNESTESIILNKQVGSVSISTIGANVTISDIDFNITTNNTPYYFTHTLQVTAGGGGDKTVTCEVLLDDVVVGTSTRTITSGSTGNIYIQTDVLVNETGTYNEVLQCRKDSGSGPATIKNAVCVGHFLVDSYGQLLNYAFGQTTNIWSNESSYRDFLVIPFNTTNITLDDEHVLDLIIDWSAIFNHASEDLISVDIDLSDGQSCASLTRDDDLGGTGSGGSVCLFKNLTTGASYNITAQIQSTPASNVTVLDEFKIIIKEFIQDTDERGTTSIFTSIGSTFGEIDNFTIENFDHASVDLFAFLSTEIRPSGADGNIDQQLNIIDGTSVTGIINENTIRDGERRITMNQEVLQSASQDNYTIQYNGSCSAASCSVLSGEMTAYFANIITPALNNFEITVYDIYDNTSIQNFTVLLSTGTIFESEDGVVTVFGSGLFNLTISSDENGGYINQTVVNHDASNDLNQSINQTNINWDCIEKVSESNLNCTSPTETQTFNYNVAGNEHSQSLNVSGYYERIISFNVTAKQQETLNATDFYSTNLTLQATSSLGTPTVCIYNISSNDYSWTDSVGGSPNTTTGLINGTYEILVDCTGFAYQTVNITIENTTQTYTFNLLTSNSFNFIFKNAQSLEIIDYETTTLELISDSQSGNYSTTNGTLYIDLLTPEFYTIRFESDSTTERFYYFSLEDRSFNNITLYLLNETLGGNVTITIVDDDDRPLVEAYLKVLRYDITSNTFLLQEIFKTDVEGKAYIETEISTEFYKFFVDYPFGTTVYSGTPQYIEDTTFLLPVILNPLYGQNFFNSIGVSGDIVFNSSTNNWRWDYSDSLNTISGACLYVYETSLVSNSLLDSGCADTSSGTILVSMTPEDGKSYTAVGVILYDTTEYYWGEKFYKAGQIQEEDTKKYRLSLILFITLAVMLLFAWNVSLLFLFTPIPLLVASLSNYVEFNWVLSGTFMLGGLILTYWINKKDK